MAPGPKDLARLARRPIRIATRLSQSPLPLVGREVDPLSLVRGRKTLHGAVGGRTVLITGASSGIGEAAAHRLAGAGAKVLLVARTADKLEAVAAGLDRAEGGGSGQAYPCDLSDIEAIDRLVERVLGDHGHVDVLVNNAGRSIRRSIALSYDRFHDYERTMQLNYFAAVKLTLGMLPGMCAAGRGQFVNVSSVGVQTRVPRFSAYIASKAALDTFADAAQAELRGDGIRFTTIHMPLVRTPMISPTKLYDRFPALSPEQAAELVARAIVHRPRRVSPTFGTAAAFADSVNPELMDLVRNRGYEMFPDSHAAKGEQPRTAEGDRTAAERAFVAATRGVHW